MTIWKDRKPGEVPAGKLVVDNVSDEFGETGGALLMHTGRPDWIKDPQTKTPMRCTAYFRTTEELDCPCCKQTVTLGATMFACEADGHPEHEWLGLDCPQCRQFVWKLCPKGELA